MKLVLRICRDMGHLSLKLSALEIRFTRRNYENIAQKASVLVTMLGCKQIAPELAFTHCGMFSDPQLAYRMSMDYMAEQEKKAAKLAAQNGGNGDGSGNQTGGQSDGEGNSGD